MSLKPLQLELINQFENLGQVNERYENLHCVNVLNGQRRGVLSLVFQAHDILQQSLVAIKVMDPDRLGDSYRIDAFDREPRILEKLEGKNRCLQLTDGLQQFSLKFDASNYPEPISVPCKFFVTEWLEEDVDDYFWRQQDFGAAEKLDIFRKLLLAVEAIHRWNVFHRDIKIDNIRVKSVRGEAMLVLIDFGTAACNTDSKLGSNYSGPVGADAYSPPEAFLGFSGERLLGKRSDSYALGALLFHLFNSQLFHLARQERTDYDKLMMSMIPIMQGGNSLEQKLELWKNHIRRFRSLTAPPEIGGPGHTLPLSISQVIAQTYMQLANFDFMHRISDLSKARKKIDTAIHILNFQESERLAIASRRKRRKLRREKIRDKQERLENHISKRMTKYVK